MNERKQAWACLLKLAKSWQGNQTPETVVTKCASCGRAIGPATIRTGETAICPVCAESMAKEKL